MLLYCINSAVFSHCLLLAYPSESFPILHLSELSSLMVTSIHPIVHSPWTIVMWMEVRLDCVHLNWSDPEQAPLQQVAFSANGFFYMHLEEKVWFHLELGGLEVKMTVFFLKLCIACKSGCSKMAEGDWTWSANLFKSNSMMRRDKKLCEGVRMMLCLKCIVPSTTLISTWGAFSLYRIAGNIGDL